MNKIRQRINKLSSGTRIALVFTVTLALLLAIFYFVIIEQGKQAFIDSIKKPGQANITSYKSNIELPSGLEAKPNVLVVQFTNKFNLSLLWVLGGLLVIAAAIGFLLGQKLITSPILHLRTAIQELKNGKRSSDMASTGIPEFDATFADFSKLAASLEEAERLRKELISDTAHELKTPLMSLLTQLEAMRDGLMSPGQKEYELLITRVYHMSQILEQLHAYTNTRSKIIHAKKQRVDIATSVHNVANQFKSLLEKNKITLTYSVADDAIVYADRALFEQLLINIFQNIVVHADAKHISLKADRHRLTISDDGIGITTDEVSKIFERFYRGAAAQKSSNPGSGLGLSIVKDICDTFGWTISVHSAPKKGFTIDITFQSEQADSRPGSR